MAVAVTYNAATRQLTVDPTETLVPNSAYTLVLDGLKDVAGNALPLTEIHFTTGDAPAVPGLVLGYACDEGAGTTVADASGRGKTGLLVNGPTWALGVSGTSVRLDGMNDYVRVNSPQHPTGDWTWGLWVYPEAVTGWIRLMEIQTSGSSGVELALTDGQLEVWYGGQRRIPPVGRVPVNAWTHLALQRQGAQLRLAVNGAQVASASGVAALSFGTCPLLWGVDADSGCTRALNGYLRGRLDAVRVYNRALSVSELQVVMGLP